MRVKSLAELQWVADPASRAGSSAGAPDDLLGKGHRERVELRAGLEARTHHCDSLAVQRGLVPELDLPKP